MAGGTVKYRHLSRDSAARKALLRGLVTQLIAHEHIHTTHAKAKEAQRMAEKLITLAKRNNEPCRRSAQGILYTPHLHIPKLFGELRQRYLSRDGGYTRVTRTESKNTYDQGESAILELVDGPCDSRFMMTAKSVARDRLNGLDTTPVTARNVEKVTRFRPKDDFEDMVRRFMAMETDGADPGMQRDQGAEEAERMAREAEEAVGKMGESVVPESVKNGGKEAAR